MVDRPILHLRGESAAAALVAARKELWESARIRPTSDAGPRLYAGRILEADDAYGRRDGLIVQGDQLSWRTVDALYDLAVLGAEVHIWAAHPAVRRAPGCEWCQRSDDIRHTALVDPIRGAGTLFVTWPRPFEPPR